ncbi:MAG TPA: tripartite tricarboxylate transporter substrate binding protein [Steroidobacteraceae bacterium]|jgi:tripartite-type tricarboxylate transporter receptor subunit TctC|nr:tripartite tricarboxylate transporter substrate binding protein [Steroidobacteraceae bacterium]
MLHERIVVLCLCLISTVAAAQSYPSKPVRLIVPFAPGGANDLVSRLIAQRLNAALGQSVVVENRGGAGGTIGLDACAKSAPDGHTLVMSPASSLTIAPSLYAKLPYDPIKDFAPIIRVASGPNMLVIHPSVPAHTLRELIAIAKSRPGRLTYASSGPTSMSGLSAALFKSMAAVDMIGVPYKGTGPAMTELLGGQVDLMIADLAIALPHVRDKRLRAIALTGSKRTALAPEVPTISESGIRGYSIVNWRGLLAPAGTARDIIVRLNGEVIKILGAPDLRDTLAREGYEPIGDTPEQFGALIRDEVARYSKLVKAAGIQAD